MLRRWPCIHAQTFDRGVVSNTPHSESRLKARTSLVFNNTNPFYLEGCVIKSLCFAKRAVCVVQLSLWVSTRNEKGVISKAMGGSPFSSLATLVETQKKRHLEHDNFIAHINLATIRKNPRLQHSLSYSVISTHKAQFVTLYSSPCTLTYLIVWS